MRDSLEKLGIPELYKGIEDVTGELILNFFAPKTRMNRMYLPRNRKCYINEKSRVTHTSISNDDIEQLLDRKLLSYDCEGLFITDEGIAYLRRN